MKPEADWIWVDGRLVPFAEATVHVLSPTLHLGYGVFEGIRAYRRSDGTSHVFRLGEHISRLVESAHLLQMELAFCRAELIDACVATLRANGLSAAYLRVLVFTDGGLPLPGHVPDSARVMIGTWPRGASLGERASATGIRCAVSSFRRLSVDASLVKAKVVGHYVNSILARREVGHAGYDEAILLDPAGAVSECTGQNLFTVRRGRVITPPLGSSILAGITRDALLTLAREAGAVVEQRVMTRDELYVADEIFVCGTASEVVPVCAVDGRQIGTGRPGPFTRRLVAAFVELVRGASNAHPEWRHGYTLDGPEPA